MQKLVFLLLALTLSPACWGKRFFDARWPPLKAVAPAWLAAPDQVLDVRWTRSRTSPAFVFGGVCHLFYGDDSEQAMVPAEAQIERCEAQGRHQRIPITSATPEHDVRRIHIYNVDSNTAVERRFAELFDPLTQGTAKSGGMASEAFYFEAPGGVCVIVTNRNINSVGHEIKHCFDGAWHQMLPNHP